jgi:Response regulator containing a CheY-like receiver domain and an HTH DNA-binding domain
LSTRILVVDDHPTVIDSVARRLAAEPDIEVVDSARSLVEAAAVLGRPRSDIDVVVCDVQMGAEAEGLRLLETFASPRRPWFLMLSGYDYPTLFRAAYERGARGYVLKTAELSEIVAAVRAVASGEMAFSAAALRHVRAAVRRPSDREIEVLALLVAGAGNEQIAHELFLSLKTVESHLRRLFNRYGLMNRTELAVLAVREGWVTRSSDSGSRP